MTAFLNRSTVEIGETSGRTLSGIAMPWDKVAMVQDLVRGRPGPRYPEAFAPSSTDVSRAQHETFPVFVGHDPGTEPIGVVKFSRSSEALMFDAPISETPRGNDYLQLAKDRAMASVSIQFRPVKDARRTFPGVAGPVLYRTEVGLRHLALAPTGYGQYEDAQVNSIRTELDETVSGAVQAADAAIDAAAKCLDPTDPTYNVGQAQALITAAQLAVDVALSMLGAVDADDVDDAESPAVALPARMELVWSTVARRRMVDRITVPDLEDAGRAAQGIGKPVSTGPGIGKPVSAQGYQEAWKLALSPADRARYVRQASGDQAKALELFKAAFAKNPGKYK